MRTEAPIALILAGGRGSRLQGIVHDRPKPMALIGGRPFLEWLVLQARAQGVRNLIFCTGHLAHLIEEYFGNGEKWGVTFRYSREQSPLGTAGAVRLAMETTDAREFVVLNGDSYCRYDLGQLAAIHAERSAALQCG